jgi:type IV pilus assembly protein PilM
MDVVMAISPQSAVDTMDACIKKAGRKTAAIDVEPMSLVRSMMTSYDDVVASKTVCVIDIGHKTTSINMYRGPKLLMPRQVPIGGEMFTRTIADNLQISFDEAESLKVNEGEIPESAAETISATPSFGAAEFQPYNPFSDDPVPADPLATPAATPAIATSDNRVYNAMVPVLEEFVAEVRRSVDYFKSRGGDVDQMILCGGGARLRGLAHFLGRSLGIQCDNYDPLRRLNVSTKKASPDLNEHREEFAVAVGNGLHIFFD